jgi:tripartite-type tricarboxylate transporter receptor subunit TctC
MGAQAGIDLVYVPYPTTPQSINDIMGGRLAVVFEGLPPLKGAIAAGSIKPLAVTSGSRLTDLPQLPAVAEMIPGFAATGWTALMAPARTPDTIVQKVNRDLRSVLAEGDLRQKLGQLGTYIHPMSSTELANFIETERVKWEPIAKRIAAVAQ